MSEPLYPIQTIRAMEQAMCKLPGLGEYPLMHRAGVAAFNQLLHHWPKAKKINIFIGKGNNGGDGIVVAGLAQMRGLSVNIYTIYGMVDISDTAQEALEDLTHTLANVIPFDPEKIEPCDLIIDAILGIGMSGAVREPALSAINCINDMDIPVFSLDVPSGLNADTGEVANAAVVADKTITFLGRKPGFYTCDGPDHVGDILFESLDCSQDSSPLWLNTQPHEPRPKRLRNTHKGNYGRIAMIGGNPNMGGAMILAAQSACQTGAGLVGVVCAAKHHPAIISRVPQVLTYDPEQLDEVLGNSTVVAIGPGLGTDAWARELLNQTMAHVQQTQKPMVIDASALTLAAEQDLQYDNWVMTPHPGEAAQLLDTDITTIQKDRWLSARKISEKYGGVTVLKGCGTIVTNLEESGVCPYGGPWLAQAGQGDVLTGIIASLLAQQVELMQAAQYGVYLHASGQGK